MNVKSSSSPKVLSNARTLLSLMAAYLVVTSGFYFSIYMIYHTWQALLAVGILLLALVAVPIAYTVLRRGYVRQTGIILVVGLIFGYGVNELIWEGLLPFHLVGGILLLFMICDMLLRREYVLWGGSLLGYLGFLAYANLWPPLHRVNQADIPPLMAYAIGTIVLLILVFASMAAYISLGRRIRTRMMILFTLFVGVPLMISGSVSTYQAATVSEEQAVTRLEFDVALRRASIESWLDSQKTSLEQVLPNKTNLIPILADRGPEPTYSMYRNDLMDDLNGLVDRSSSFTRIYIIDLNGLIVFSTDPALEGTYVLTREFFRGSLTGYVTVPAFFAEGSDEPQFQMAMPIMDDANQTVGAIAADVGFEELNRLMSVGVEDSQTGETVLFNRQGLLVSPSRFSGFKIGEFYPLPVGLMRSIDNQIEAGTDVYQSYRGEDVLGAYGWIDGLHVMLVAEKSLYEARYPTYRAIAFTLVVIVVSLALALVVAWFTAIRIANPINNLAQTANAVTSGNLNLLAEIEQDDEVGALAQAFNSMTAQLRGQLAQLEQRVAERTADIERRSIELQMAAEIARDASRAQNFDQLIHNAVNLVAERFNFYHAGIFLLDEFGEHAALRAATGEMGQLMVSHGHKVKLDDKSVVGRVALEGIARIASDVGENAEQFQNPLLPLTHSEMVLPLKVGDRTIGVLDLQSEKESAFTHEDMIVLQTMSDQLAVAIENARLLREVQSSLEQLEALYGSYSKHSWQKIMSARAVAGYQYDITRGVAPLGDENAPAPSDRLPAIVPLKVRGQVVGNLKVYPVGQNWSDNQMFVLNALGERISQAVESARLYEESQQRAINEQLLSNISANIRATMDVDSILQTTIREIRQAFDLQEVEIRLDVEEMGRGPQDATPETTVTGN